MQVTRSSWDWKTDFARNISRLWFQKEIDTRTRPGRRLEDHSYLLVKWLTGIELGAEMPSISLQRVAGLGAAESSGTGPSDEGRHTEYIGYPSRIRDGHPLYYRALAIRNVA